MPRYRLSLSSAVCLLAACGGSQSVSESHHVRATLAEPPTAKIRPTELEAHGDVRVDDYYWLRERDNPEVVEYLEAENSGGSGRFKQHHETALDYAFLLDLEGISE